MGDRFDARDRRGLEVLADVALAEGDPGRAIELIAASERIRDEAELPHRGEAVARAERRAERARDALGAAADAAIAAARTREVTAVVEAAAKSIA